MPRRHVHFASSIRLLLVLAALSSCAPGASPGGAPPGGGPGVAPGTPPGSGQLRPLDPLTPAEQEAAGRITLADPRVREIIAGRAHGIALVDLRVPKPAEPYEDDADRPPPLRRQAEVLVSVFERSFTGIRALVDLEARTVTEVERLEDRPAALTDTLAAGTRVPIAPAEVELATRLVAATAEFQALQREAREEVSTEFLPITVIDPAYCPSGRCLELLFRRGNAYATTTAVVDILGQSVRFRRAQR